ncbi:MAG: DegT/DnrJ/EryC1/StrS family aminotransferase [Armatimonadota bacterium]
MTQSTANELAINGGSKSFSQMAGKPEPKVGVEEFFSIAERFGFTPDAMERLHAAVSNEDFLGGGPNLARYYTAFPPDTKSDAFEGLAREKFNTKHALAVSSGTGALHSAFVAAGVGPGTEVIVPGMGFAATGIAVILAGGVPVLCDVDESLLLDPAKIEACITPRTVALAPTHHWGNIADMAPIMEIARKHHLKVIEDCAQAPGGKYQGKYVGTIGDLGCFSISAYKIIGGGEGGMVITDDSHLFDRVCQLAESGGLWRPDRFAPPRYEGELFPGTNYRLSEMEAAVNVVQLGKMDGICNRHRHVSQRVREQLMPCKEITPQKIHDADGYIGYSLRFFPATFELSRKITDALRAEGIGASTRGKDHAPDWHVGKDMFPIILKTGHIPGGSVFDDPRYLNKGGHVEYVGVCPVAADLYAREVSVSLDQWYSDQDCDNIAAGMNKVFSAYCTEDSNGKKWI